MKTSVLALIVTLGGIGIGGGVVAAKMTAHRPQPKPVMAKVVDLDPSEAAVVAEARCQPRPLTFSGFAAAYDQGCLDASWACGLSGLDWMDILRSDAAGVRSLIQIEQDRRVTGIINQAAISYVAMRLMVGCGPSRASN